MLIQPGYFQDTYFSEYYWSGDWWVEYGEVEPDRMAQYDQTKWVGVKPTVKTAQGPGKQVEIADEDTEVLAANDERTSFVIVAKGAVSVFVKLGTGATVACPELEPGDVLSCDDYCGPIHGIVDNGSGRLDVFEV